MTKHVDPGIRVYSLFTACFDEAIKQLNHAYHYSNKSQEDAA